MKKYQSFYLKTFSLVVKFSVYFNRRFFVMFCWTPSGKPLVRGFLKRTVMTEQTVQIQSNLDSSNTDGSFTMANSNSFFSPFEVLPIAQENKYLGKFSYFIVTLYVVCTHLNRLIDAILMSTLCIQLLCRKSKKILKLSPFAS